MRSGAPAASRTMVGMTGTTGTTGAIGAIGPAHGPAPGSPQRETSSEAPAWRTEWYECMRVTRMHKFRLTIWKGMKLDEKAVSSFQLFRSPVLHHLGFQLLWGSTLQHVLWHSGHTILQGAHTKA